MDYSKLIYMSLLGVVCILTPFLNVTDYHDPKQVLSAIITGVAGVAALFTKPPQKTP